MQLWIDLALLIGWHIAAYFIITAPSKKARP